MNPTTDRLAITGGLLRAIPGLLALLLVAAMAAGPSPPFEPVSATDHTSRLPVSVPIPDVDQAPVQRPAAAPTMVFYLVATPSQEFQVDWAENVDQQDLQRSYRLLLARDAAEWEAARKQVLDYLLSRTGDSSVRLVDMRAIE
jgi:hypothetical protein